MCLFPVGNGGLNMQPVAPPTDLAKKLQKKLWIILWVHLALALTFFFITLSQGLQDIFLVLILWCGISKVHYCQLLIYMLFSMYNWVNFFSIIGFAIQQGKFASAFAAGGASTMIMLLILSFLVFYPVAIYFCFKAYREFKGLLYDNGQLGTGGVANQMFRNNNNNEGGYQNMDN